MIYRNLVRCTSYKRVNHRLSDGRIPAQSRSQGDIMTGLVFSEMAHAD